MHINDILKAAIERHASDLHLKVGSHPVMRVDGRLQPMVDLTRLQPEDTLACAFAIMTSRQKEKFKEQLEIDIAYSIPGLGRFRCNVFQQRGTVGLVLRVIPVKVLNFADLGLPPVVEQICEERRGLILCTGATGSGKSTALAAMIEYINSTRSEHIVTIEDPIEFLHRDKKALVNQREVDVDTRSFGVALRSALRQDPDVIHVGELRDLDATATVLTAADAGHLVLTTMHTMDAMETIGRMISIFPPDDQKHVRLKLASVLKAIISLRLVPRADGKGRVPAVEILRATPFVRECIENKDRTRHLLDAMAAGTAQHGMQTFDQSLLQLVDAGLIAREEALRRASNPEEFRTRTAGAQASPDGAPAAKETEGRKRGEGDKSFDFGNNF